MTIAEAYLGGSRVFQRLKNGPHGQLIERYAARLVEDGLAQHGTWRCLNVVGGLLSWMASHRIKVTDLNEARVERYLRDRGNRQTIQAGDRAALKRWLSVLRATGTIAPAVQSQTTPHDQIFAEFGDYLQRERGLTPKSIVRHLPFIRQFLREVCPAGAERPRRDPSGSRDRLHRASRPGLEPIIREGDVLVVAHIPQISPSPGSAPSLSRRLRSVDQAMEAARACQAISLPRRFRRSSSVATGRPPWGGGTTPSS